MSAAAVHRRPRSLRLPAARRIALTGDAFAIGGLVVWTLALAALTWGRWGDLTMDTGYDLLAASRTAQGELPYIDYVYFYGPAGPLLLGGIFALAGPAVWPAVALGLLLAALAIGLTYRLARRFAAPPASAGAAALVAVAALSGANNSYVLPHSISAPLAIVLALVALLLLVGRDGQPAGTRSRLVLAGLACGLAAVTRLELAVPLCVAVTLWLGLEVRRGRSIRDAASVLAPAAALPLLVYGLFATRVGVQDLLWENLYPRDFIDGAGHVILDAHAPRTPASLAELGVHVVAYAAGVAAMLVAAAAIVAGAPPAQARARAARCLRGRLPGRAGRAPRDRPVLPRVGLRVDPRRGVAGRNLRPAARHARRRARLPGPRRRHADDLRVVPAVPERAAPGGDRVPAAARRRLPGLAARRGAARRARWGRDGSCCSRSRAPACSPSDARRETATVSGPGGALAARPADAPALQRALDLIATHTRPGDPVLIAPQLTALYVMADRSDPLRQLSLLPGALPTPAAEARRSLAWATCGSP